MTISNESSRLVALLTKTASIDLTVAASLNEAVSGSVQGNAPLAYSGSISPLRFGSLTFMG